MGGNALREFGARRYERDEFDRLKNHIQFLLSYRMTSTASRVIPYFRKKDSFGDLDILVMRERIPERIDPMIFFRDILATDVIRRNGNVISLLVEELQVDLILVKENDFSFACDYFSYNDLGNLLGRLTHKLGLKLGQTGLSLVIREEHNHIVKELQLTQDFDHVLRILGLDVKKFRDGFNTLDDIFEYVMSSKYFHSDVFLLENRNHTSSVRDRKRHVYMKFLKKIQSEHPMNMYLHRTKDSRGGYSVNTDFIDLIEHEFPGTINRIEEAYDDHEVHQKFNRFMNGNILMTRTKLTGKDLGDFITQHKLSGKFYTHEEKKGMLKNPDQIILLVDEAIESFTL